MQRVILLDLAGQTRPLRLHEDGYDALRAYLDHARARLGDDPDAREVIDDLERSIGARLAGLAGPSDRVLDQADVLAVLDEVGAVDAEAAGPASPASGAGARPRRRRLYRIREGQEITGVCTGLAAYADLDPSMVRWIVVLLTLVTVGLFAFVYLLLMFRLPVVATQADWIAAMRELEADEAS